ncbi:hypothetical protein BAE44_0018081 [Dichanthelium oligosanthes]|uniref:Uncharacterized protein n=1 Tax=Dichanthelium oligosanthes TaxID=888268 RepID=A0A1E5V6V9_9POAL|nr:hypothetical protein BAE44_0018081 [Dichanthelium oligosanthes]
MSRTIGGKIASTSCKKRTFVVQQEDKFVPQFDMESDVGCDVTKNHDVTPSPIVIAIPKFSPTVEVKKQEDNAIPSNDSLKSEQEHIDEPAAHIGQEMLDKGTLQDGRNKIAAAVPPCVSVQFVRQQNHDTSSECAKSVTKCDMKFHTSSDTEEASNLIEKSAQRFSLRADSKNKSVDIAPDSGSDKSILKDVDVVSHNIKVSNENEKEMAAHHSTTLDERSEKVATIQNHFIVD